MGGALALDAAWLFAAFLVILTLAAVGIAARRFLLERGGGTVECGLRRGEKRDQRAQEDELRSASLRCDPEVEPCRIA